MLDSRNSRSRPNRSTTKYSSGRFGSSPLCLKVEDVRRTSRLELQSVRSKHDFERKCHLSFTVFHALFISEYFMIHAQYYNTSTNNSQTSTDSWSYLDFYPRSIHLFIRSHSFFMSPLFVSGSPNFDSIAQSGCEAKTRRSPPRLCTSDHQPRGKCRFFVQPKQSISGGEIRQLGDHLMGNSKNAPVAGWGSAVFSGDLDTN